MRWFWAKHREVDALRSRVETLEAQLSELSDQASRERQGLDAAVTKLDERLARATRAGEVNAEAIEARRSAIDDVRRAIERMPDVEGPLLNIAARLDRFELQNHADLAETRHASLALAERLELLRRNAPDLSLASPLDRTAGQ